MTKLTAISFAVIVVANGLCLSANAQQSPGSIKNAVEKAVLQNPEVKLRFHNLEAAKAERKVGEGGWLPRIDLEVAGGSYETKNPV